MEDLLSDRKADARLLFIADQRQIVVEEVEGLVHLALAEARIDLDQKLGEGKAGHGAIGAACEFEWKIEPAIADEDGDAAPGVTGFGLADA